MAASLMLIDEDSSACGELRHALVREGYRVACARPELAAIRTMLVDNPDLVILGVNCCEGDWRFCHRLLPFLDQPLLLLLVTANPLDQVRGLELGADDCLIRPVNTIELMARIRALLRRQDDRSQRSKRSYFTDQGLVVDSTRREVWLNGQPLALTPTEYRILCCFIQHLGEVVSQERLMMQVWGPNYTDSPGAVKQYVYQLRKKLEPDPHRPQRIMTLRGVGYVFRSLADSGMPNRA